MAASRSLPPSHQLEMHSTPTPKSGRQEEEKPYRFNLTEMLEPGRGLGLPSYTRLSISDQNQSSVSIKRWHWDAIYSVHCKGAERSAGSSGWLHGAPHAL